MFNHKTEGNVTFASLSRGKVVTKTTIDNPLGKKRTDKTGKEVNELFYDNVGGKITNITIEPSKFDESAMVIYVELTGDSKVVLQINLNSGYGRSFARQIEQVNFHHDVLFTPWMKTFKNDDGTERTVFNVYLSQPGVKLSPVKFENEPEVKFKNVRGKQVADPESQAALEDFFIKKINDAFINSASQIDTTKVKAEETKTAQSKNENKKVKMVEFFDND